MLISMNDILQLTREHRFAIGAFNVADSCFIRALVEEAEATRSPAIISIHPNEHDFVTDAFFAYVREKTLKRNSRSFLPRRSRPPGRWKRRGCWRRLLEKYN